ncbi:MAG: NADH-quinone oxidoreductase subunit C [Cyclobacteriaceae bacterium]|nr:NADH-quinone oxidoreductase subunit C [Cyclobacteriaceae bacterium]
MDRESLQNIITTWSSEIEFSAAAVAADEEAGVKASPGTQFLEVIIKPNQLLEFAEKLRNEADLQFNFMFSLTCVDFADYFMMVYHLRSIELKHEVVLKVKIEDKETPEVETLCHTWRTAEFLEREVYDLFGVVFHNHPDLRRILLDDDWKGYPLRKDYADPVNMISI